MQKAESPEGHFQEDDAACLIRDILDAIRYMHDEKHIVHRDLKVCMGGCVTYQLIDSIVGR